MSQYSGLVQAKYPSPSREQTQNLFGDLLAKLDLIPSRPPVTR